MSSNVFKEEALHYKRHHSTKTTPHPHPEKWYDEHNTFLEEHL